MEMDMENIECPVCSELITLKSPPRKNDTLTCPLCDETLLIVSKSPLRVQRVLDKWDDEKEVDWEWGAMHGSKNTRSGKAYYDNDLEYAMPQSRQGKNGRNKR